MNLRIGLNGTCFTNTPSGANQRFLGLYGQLVRENPNFQFTVFTSPGSELRQLFPHEENVEFSEVPLKSRNRYVRHLESLYYFRKELAKRRLHIFEQFHLPFVKSPNGKTILTIHDIRSVVSKSSLTERLIGKVVFARAIKQADHLVTVSHSMKAEILKHFPYASISVIYNGFEPWGEIGENDLDAFRVKYSLPSKFLLSVGHLEERKNYRLLIEAVALLRAQSVPHSLVIIGNDNGERSKLESYIQSIGMASQVRLLSGLSHTEVQCAYRLSQLLIFPSRYEGFGIPILEAMAVGCPMVLSNIPVFQEITEGKCHYFSPEDPEAMAVAISTVLDSKMEQDRIISYGKKRLEDFQYGHLAVQMRDLYYQLSR